MLFMQMRRIITLISICFPLLCGAQELGHFYYAAVGLWLQQISYRLQKNGDVPITNIFLETTGISALAPSLSVYFGIRL